MCSFSHLGAHYIGLVMLRCSQCTTLLSSFHKFVLLQKTLKLQSSKISPINTYALVKRLTTTASLASSNNETNPGLRITEACAKVIV